MEIFPPELKRITFLVKLTANASTYEVQGLKDTDLKIWACFLANKVTSLPNWIIAKFFQINPNYMNHRLKNLAVQCLVNDLVKTEMQCLEDAYKELDTIEAGA